MPLNEDVGNLNVLITATDTGGLSASSSFALNVINITTPRLPMPMRVRQSKTAAR